MINPQRLPNRCLHPGSFHHSLTANVLAASGNRQIDTGLLLHGVPGPAKALLLQIALPVPAVVSHVDVKTNRLGQRDRFATDHCRLGQK